MDEYNFFKRFRLTKRTCLRVLGEIEEAIEFLDNLNNNVSPMNQLLAADLEQEWRLSKLRIVRKVSVVRKWPNTNGLIIFWNFLGDSGYPLWEYFLTPLANPRTRGEQLYNESHIRTRNTVKRLFGNWKRRFPVLAYIHTTGVLQNIARAMHENHVPGLPEVNVNEFNALTEAGNIPDNAAGGQNIGVDHVRNLLFNNYFNNM